MKNFIILKGSTKRVRLSAGERIHGRRDLEKKEEEKVGEKKKTCCKFLVKNQEKKREEEKVGEKDKIKCIRL